ncbi:uncharacterized protein LOC123866913 [Maniola jurtina]|uniref:uncharacterized protein LOC123866913 n=1 Tax=Maniola jurtina TaxID=191418 RepID=UPI001E68DA76|nr:uncharacterized protein LOC123866913 [Maniola jurtina]
MKNNSKEDELEGWTKEEKFELLEALREVGTNDVEKIKELISNKTEVEIRSALDFYINKALATPTIRRKERKVFPPVVPLAGWAKYIIDTHGLKEYQTETYIALRLIAEFEDKPPSVMTEKIDFRKLYQILAEALEGKPLSKDKYISSVIYKCIVETALTSKAFNKGSTCFKSILQASCNPVEEDVNEFSQPTDNVEFATLRNVSSRKNYNPLNIPVNNLRYSTRV